MKKWKNMKFSLFRKITNFENVTFSKISTEKKVIEKKSTFFEIFEIFEFSSFPKIKFSSKKLKFPKNFQFLFFYHISCPNPASGVAQLPLCRPWARQTHPRKSEKSCFWWFFYGFSIKNDANDLLIRPHLALRSGFEASRTSNGPSSELKWSYEDFPSMWISN